MGPAQKKNVRIYTYDHAGHSSLYINLHGQEGGTTISGFHPLYSPLYPIARGVSKLQNISNFKMGEDERTQNHQNPFPPFEQNPPKFPQRLHFASMYPQNIPTAPAFCKHISSKHPHSACILQAYLLLTSPQRLHFANMYPQKSPKSLHFASISPPNIPQRLHFASMYPQKSHLYPIARGVARTQEHAGTHEGARYIHIHSTLHSTLLQGEYPNFKTCPNIKMGEEEHARGHTGARPLKSPQRLHFASISPPNIPTAPAFCKHVSRNIPTAPAFCKHISSRHPHSACILQACIPKNPHSACILQADLLQTSQQRLHFASISPPNIPTAPAFCKHVSAKLASLPYIARGLARTHTQAHTKEHSPLCPFARGVSKLQNQNQNGRGGASTHARTQEHAKSPLVTFPPWLAPSRLFSWPLFRPLIGVFGQAALARLWIRARPRCVSSRLWARCRNTPIVLALCLVQCRLKISKLTDHFNKISAHLSSNLNPSIAKRKILKYINITHFGHQGNPSLPNIPPLAWTKEEKEKKEAKERRENAIAHISACNAPQGVARCMATSSTIAPSHKYPAQTQTPKTPRSAAPIPNPLLPIRPFVHPPPIRELLFEPPPPPTQAKSHRRPKPAPISAPKGKRKNAAKQKN